MPSDIDEATWMDGGEREASELGRQIFPESKMNPLRSLWD